ncbi:hypothetical protein SCUP234_04991 [Seiridium cupressi]
MTPLRTTLAGHYLPCEVWIMILSHLGSYQDSRSFIRASSYALTVYLRLRKQTLQKVVQNSLLNESIPAAGLAIVRFPHIPDKISYDQSRIFTDQITGHLEDRQNATQSTLTLKECLRLVRLDAVITRFITDYWQKSRAVARHDAHRILPFKYHSSLLPSADYRFPTDDMSNTELIQPGGPALGELTQLKQAFYLYELFTTALRSQKNRRLVSKTELLRILVGDLPCRDVDGFKTAWWYMERQYTLLHEQLYNDFWDLVNEAAAETYMQQTCQDISHPFPMSFQEVTETREGQLCKYMQPQFGSHSATAGFCLLELALGSGRTGYRYLTQSTYDQINAPNLVGFTDSSYTVLLRKDLIFLRGRPVSTEEDMYEPITAVQVWRS